MFSYFLQKNKMVYVGIMLAALFCIPHLSLASVVSLHTDESSVGTTGTFLLTLSIEADQSINTVSLKLPLPAGVKVQDIYDGNSIINFWVDKPQVNTTDNSLSFSGIIPGGYSGKDGQLLTLKVSVSEQSIAHFSYDLDHSKVYLNTPTADEDTLIGKSLDLTVIAGQENKKSDITDTTPPEDFSVLISHDTDVAKNLWQAVFATQDKGVGIDHYEVAESWKKTDSFKGLVWHPTTSPYTLHDQDAKSYVYVKAIDKNGNERITITQPVHYAPWYELILGYIIDNILALVVLLIFLIVLFFYFTK